MLHVMTVGNALIFNVLVASSENAELVGDALRVLLVLKQPVCVVLERISATALAFDPRVDGRTLTFEQEGENPRRPEEPELEGDEPPEIDFEPLFLRDRETRSRWRAISAECVEGELLGRRLRRLPTSMGFWFAWSRFYPGAELMPPPENTR